MNGYAGFHSISSEEIAVFIAGFHDISSEKIAVFVREARTAADMMGISVSEFFGELQRLFYAMEAIRSVLDGALNAIRETLELPPPLSKLERLWRTQRRRADRERMRVLLKYLDFLFVVRKYKPP